MTSSRLEETIVFLSIGYGGWSGKHAQTRPNQTSHVSHYGDTWKTHRFAPDAIGVDLTVIPVGELAELSIPGPMVDPRVPDGMRRTLDGLEPFDPTPVDGRDPRLGNARSLDYVSPATYAGIAERFGARVFRPADEVTS